MRENKGRVYSNSNPMLDLAWFSVMAACIKLLLIPSYHSSDFEVHRHWLALTHSLPLSQWYLDESSPWTLDYPPFFSYFERFLSIFANIIDPLIVDINKGVNYNTNTVIYFQRMSVIASDFVLFYGVYCLTKNMKSRKRYMICVLVLWSPALVIIDHMHFQYNGFLLGFLLMSLSYLEEGRDVIGGFIFAVLLCFKHLFAVAAPVYFVYLLRHYCCGGGFLRCVKRLLTMGSVVASVFAVAYGPFLFYGQMTQIIRRMFPFDRGLCHAYWAPNVWVFYIIFDKGIAILLRLFGFNILSQKASFTGGLVGDSSPLLVLPRVSPLITFIMVLLSLFPCFLKIWRNPQPCLVIRWVAYAYTCGFMFGWHVHEKASLHFVVPLAIVSLYNPEEARHYFLLSIASCYSLFPLLFQPQEYPIKVLLLLQHSILMWYAFSHYFQNPSSLSSNKNEAILKSNRDSNLDAQFEMGVYGKWYLIGVLVVEGWVQILHPLCFGDRLPFVPLMMISVYCALGIAYSWAFQVSAIVRD